MTPMQFYKERLQEPMQETFDVLCLTAKEGKKLYKYFVKIDDDGGGTVDEDEFHEYFELQKTKFSVMLFSEVDVDESGELNFQEFLVGMWNICTMNERHMVKYMFDIFDADTSGTLDINECDALVRMLYDVEDNTPEMERILEDMDANGDGTITLDELCDYNRANPQLLQPGFELQETIKRKIFGQKFWQRICEAREEAHGEHADIRSIIRKRRLQRQAETEAAEAAELEMRLEEERIAREAAEQQAKIDRENAAKAEAEKLAAETEAQRKLREATADYEKVRREYEEMLGTEMGEAEEERLVSKRKEVRTVANSMLRAREAHALSERALATERLRMQLRDTVKLFFEGPEGKLLLQQLQDDEVRLMQSAAGSGFMITRNVKERAAELATKKYFDNRFARELAVMNIEYEEMLEGVNTANYATKKEVIDVLGDLARLKKKWLWVQMLDSQSNEYYYYSEAVGTSVWEKPFNNPYDICKGCQKKLTAVKRCRKCKAEFCVECDPVQHSENSVGHVRFDIHLDELDWRKRWRRYTKLVKETEESWEIPDFTSRKFLGFTSSEIKAQDAAFLAEGTER
eukprot:g3417.t1